MQMIFCSHYRRQCLTGLPWWSSGEEFACQCGGHGFNTWSGKNPTCRWTPKPMRHNYWACAAATEARKPRAHALQQEKPPKCETTHQNKKNILYLPRVEKACVWQWRHSTAKKMKKFKKKENIPLLWPSKSYSLAWTQMNWILTSTYTQCIMQVYS